MRRQENFQGNRLDLLEEAITLYGTYSTNSMEEIVDAINHLHKRT